MNQLDHESKPSKAPLIASCAWSAAFIILTALALAAYIAMPERGAAIARVIDWGLSWFR
jgi:hypothetical protein